MIFIVGYSRSGTKLMNEVLSKLGIADIVPEVHFFEQIYDFSAPDRHRNRILSVDEASKIKCKFLRIVSRVGNRLDNGRPIADIEASMDDFIAKSGRLSAIDIYRQLLRELSGGRPIDPTPRNAFYITEIAELFPESRFIYMLRDPRDCILSQDLKWKTYRDEKKRTAESLRLWLNYNPLLMATFWRNSLRSYHAASQGPSRRRVLKVGYEDMVKKPEEVAGTIQDFLDGGAKEPDWSFIRRENTGKWRTGLSLATVHIIQLAVGNLLEASGYKKTRIPASAKAQSIGLLCYYTAKIPIAFLLNLSRMASPLQTVKRRVFHA